MKNRTTGTLSGCIVWILVAGILSSCLLPIFSVIGSVTSFSQYAIKLTGNYLCPDGTTPESYMYDTTTTDDFGNTQPATGVELHCIDQNGTIVKNDPVLYAFIWIGIFVAIGLIISGILAFVFAAPAGVLITRFLNRRQKPDISANIEPQ
jgi:ABC-type glycerol-3-phosphate transport system permease component